MSLRSIRRSTSVILGQLLKIPNTRELSNEEQFTVPTKDELINVKVEGLRLINWRKIQTEGVDADKYFGRLNVQIYVQHDISEFADLTDEPAQKPDKIILSVVTDSSVRYFEAQPGPTNKFFARNIEPTGVVVTCIDRDRLLFNINISTKKHWDLDFRFNGQVLKPMAQ